MLETEYSTRLNSQVRRSFDKNSEEWVFSIVDVIGVLTSSENPRNYWKVLKNRLKNTQNQLVTRCNPLKLEAKDGKFYLTDTGNTDTILHILGIVSKENIPYFKRYVESLNTPKTENLVYLKPNQNHPQKNNLEDITNKTSSYPQASDTDSEFIIMVDLYTKNNYLIAEAFMAGVSLSDIKITTTIQTLDIQGHRELINKIDPENYQTQEIPWGMFSRHIELPFEIDINKVQAVDSKGLLTISMPIINKSYTRKIKIN